MDGKWHKTETLIEAQKLFDEGFGYSLVAKTLGVDKYTAREWQYKHRIGRILGLGHMTYHKHYSAETKLAAVQMFLEGATKSEVMQQFAIQSRGVLNKWLAIYREHGAEGLEPKTKGRPKQTVSDETDAQRIGRLEMEVEVLKKYNALLAEEDYARNKKRK